MVRTFGKACTTKLKRRLAVLEAAESLADVPKQRPERCHALHADRQGQFAVDVEHPFRLVFEPADLDECTTGDGNIDERRVKAIRILAPQSHHRGLSLMATETTALDYAPDYLVPPGEILEETLEARGIGKKAFAERIGRTPKFVSELIAGKAPLTPETALAIQHVLNQPASLWANLEANYRLRLASREQQAILAGQVDWAERFPLGDLARYGLIPRTKDVLDRVRHLLDFLGVSSAEAWRRQLATSRALYRASAAFEMQPEAISAWLRWGEKLAGSLDCRPFDEARFRTALAAIRGMTCRPVDEFRPRMIELCAEAGVAVVFTPELRGTRLSGAARWLAPKKALIQLSLRHKTDDHLWFTFFHEAGHILGHGKREAFLDVANGPDVTTDERKAKEEEANAFARDLLIPKAAWAAFRRHPGFVSAAAVVAFAEKMGIAPGIVVGRLQHEGHLPHTHLNRLKRRYQWQLDRQAPRSAAR